MQSSLSELPIGPADSSESVFDIVVTTVAVSETERAVERIGGCDGSHPALRSSSDFVYGLVARSTQEVNQTDCLPVVWPGQYHFVSGT